EVAFDVTRERAGEDDEGRDTRQIPQLVEQHVELLRPHGRAPLVDLAQRSRSWINDRGRGAGLVGDADEVVQDRLRGELVDEPVPGAAAGKSRRDHGRL